MDKEDESKRNFMEAERQRVITEEKLKQLKESYTKFNVLNNETDIVTRKIKENYLKALRQNITDSKHELTKRAEAVEKERENLRLRQMERKTVEALKEKRQTAFYKELDDKERKANDEFALYSYIRNTERR
jgi:flagellar FliJ protein